MSRQTYSYQRRNLATARGMTWGKETIERLALVLRRHDNFYDLDPADPIIFYRAGVKAVLEALSISEVLKAIPLRAALDAVEHDAREKERVPIDTGGDI